MIREVKVITTGYAPEFGQTMGLIYNAITPSGTQPRQGAGKLPVPARRLRRQAVLLDGQQAPVDVNLFHRRCRRAIVKDRTFFFGGYENTKRDLSASRVITITPATRPPWA